MDFQGIDHVACTSEDSKWQSCWVTWTRHFCECGLIQIFSFFRFFFYSTLYIIDLVIRITLLCYLLHYLTSCSVDWYDGFATNLVVIIHTTQLFVLEFHLNTHTPHICTYTQTHKCMYTYNYCFRFSSINFTICFSLSIVTLLLNTSSYSSMLYCMHFPLVFHICQISVLPHLVFFFALWA